MRPPIGGLWEYKDPVRIVIRRQKNIGAFRLMLLVMFLSILPF
jgi:hypothetical protein